MNCPKQFWHHDHQSQDYNLRRVELMNSDAWHLTAWVMNDGSLTIPPRLIRRFDQISEFLCVNLLFVTDNHLKISMLSEIQTWNFRYNMHAKLISSFSYTSISDWKVVSLNFSTCSWIQLSQYISGGKCDRLAFFICLQVQDYFKS